MSIIDKFTTAITTIPDQISKVNNNHEKTDQHICSLALKTLGIFSLAATTGTSIGLITGAPITIPAIATIAGFILLGHTLLTIGENIRENVDASFVRRWCESGKNEGKGLWAGFTTWLNSKNSDEAYTAASVAYDATQINNTYLRGSFLHPIVKAFLKI